MKKKLFYSVNEAISYGTRLLSRYKIDEPKSSVAHFLMNILDVSYAELQMSLARNLSYIQWTCYHNYLLRRCLHEPVQYIIGKVSFMRMDFWIHSAVLIPRPETEEMVHLILSRWEKKENLYVWDIGTGCGCIGLSLKKRCPSWIVSCWDNNPAAVYLAMNNAKKFGLTPLFLCEDFRTITKSSTIPRKTHIIVSNPPYISFKKWKELSFQVRTYEPISALICYDFSLLLRNFEGLSSHCLYSNGWLILEIDTQWVQLIFEIFDCKKWNVQIVNDYFKKPRFMFAQLNT